MILMSVSFLAGAGQYYSFKLRRMNKQVAVHLQLSNQVFDYLIQY